MARLRDNGELIPISEISQIHLPVPGEWTVEVEKTVDLWKAKTFKDVVKEEDQKVVSRMVVSGDPFITAKTEEGKVIHIMWEKVASYEPHVV